MIGKLRSVALDATDHRALAHFYRDLLDGEVAFEDDEWATVRTPDGYRLGFQPAPDLVAPEWPSQDRPQQIHLDIQVPDRDVARERAEVLGARHLGGGETWYVMADPAGHPFCLSINAEQTEPIRVFGVNVDCADPKGLAAFYGELLGMELKYAGDEGDAGMAWIGTDGPLGNVLFQGVSNYSAPRWPDPAHPQQMHFDIKVDDIETAEKQALEIGATKLPGEGGNWRVYADPAGHPFCLLW